MSDEENAYYFKESITFNRYLIKEFTKYYLKKHNLTKLPENLEITIDNDTDLIKFLVDIYVKKTKPFNAYIINKNIEMLNNYFLTGEECLFLRDIKKMSNNTIY